MTEATRTEVDADPDSILFVSEQVYVVVAAAHRSELRPCHLFMRSDSLNFPGRALE